MKEISGELIRDLCSVDFRGKSVTRKLIENYRKSLLDEVKMLIVKEITIAQSENEKTSRLTSLYNKIK